MVVCVNKCMNIFQTYRARLVIRYAIKHRILRTRRYVLYVDIDDGGLRPGRRPSSSSSTTSLPCTQRQRS